MFFLPTLFVLSLDLFSVAAYLEATAEPTATDHGLHQMGWSPKPTVKPVQYKGRMPLHGLFARQAGEYDVCGYVEGSLDNPVTCTSSRSCFSHDRYSAMGCCYHSFNLPDECGHYTRCVDRPDMDSCTGACALNLAVLKCSELDAPYCKTFQFPGPLYNYGCASVSGYSRSVKWTYDTFDDLPESTPLVKGPTPTESGGNIAPPPGPTLVPSGDGGDGRERKPGPPIGVIIGGTVAGLVVIGSAVSFVIWLVLRRNKTPEPAFAVPPVYQQQPPMKTDSYYGNQPVYSPQQPEPPQPQLHQLPAHQTPIPPGS